MLCLTSIAFNISIYYVIKFLELTSPCKYSNHYLPNSLPYTYHPLLPPTLNRNLSFIHIKLRGLSYIYVAPDLERNQIGRPILNEQSSFMIARSDFVQDQARHIRFSAETGVAMWNAMSILEFEFDLRLILVVHIFE